MYLPGGWMRSSTCRTSPCGVAFGAAATGGADGGGVGLGEASLDDDCGLKSLWKSFVW